MTGPPTPAILNTASSQNTNLVACYPTVGMPVDPLQDLKGGINLSPTNAPALSSTDWGDALTFTGTEYLSAAAVPVSAFPYTITGWAQRNDDGNYCIYQMTDSNGTSSKFVLVAFSGSKLQVLSIHGGVASDWVACPNDVAIGEKVFFAFVATNSSTRLLYVNSQTPQAGSGASIDSITGGNASYIGAADLGTSMGFFMEGHVFDVRVHNAALDSTQVDELRDAGTRWELYTPEPTPSFRVPVSQPQFDLAEPINHSNPDTSGLEFLVMPMLGAGLGVIDRIRLRRPQNSGTKAVLEPDSELVSRLRFDGEGHEIYSFPWANLGRSYTIMTWFRVDAELVWDPFDVSEQIAVLISMPDVGIVAYANEDGPATVYTVLTNSVDNTVFGEVPIVDGQWYVATTVFHASGNVDFALDGEIADSGPITGHTMSGGPLRVGSSTDDPETAMFAQHPISIGGVALWSRALGPAHIKRLSEVAGWMDMLNKSKRTRRYTSTVSKSIVLPVKRVNQVSDVPGPVAVW